MKQGRMVRDVQGRVSDEVCERTNGPQIKRRSFLAGVAGTALAVGLDGRRALAQSSNSIVNLALVAVHRVS